MIKVCLISPENDQGLISGILGKKSEFPEEKLAKSIQNECNNMSQSINHQKGQKVVYLG